MNSGSRTPCAACVGADTNHISHWLSAGSYIVGSKIAVERLPFYNSLYGVADTLVTQLAPFGFGGGRMLGMFTTTKDISTATSQRSRLLWEEAERRSFNLEQVLSFGKPIDAFRGIYKGKTFFFKSMPLVVSDSALRMDDKVFFKKTMTAAGLPVPRSYSITNLRAAQKALAELSVVCVKPQTGSNSRHTYPFVRTPDELKAALKSVQQISPFASVEEHLEGNLCRATCVGGKLVGFLESSHPHVTGDGTSTVADLIEKLNASKLPGTEDLVADELVRGYIRRRGYELDAIPEPGTRIQLTYRGGRSSASANREYGRTIHPSFISIIERAAVLTDLPVVGFDIIIPDPLTSAHEQHWGFVEANSLPWTDLHANPYYGDPIDLSPAIWDLWESQQTIR